MIARFRVRLPVLNTSSAHSLQPVAPLFAAYTERSCSMLVSQQLCQSHEIAGIAVEKLMGHRVAK